MRLSFYLIFISLLSSTGFAQPESLSSNPILEIFIEPESEAERIRSFLPVEVGDEWNEDLASVLEKYLESTQDYRDVRVTWDQDLGRITIRASALKFFDEVVWTDFKPSGSREIEASCISARESINLSQSRTGQITQCILRSMQRQGFLDAQILLLPEDLILRIELIPGDRYRIRDMRFEGNSYLSDRYLRLRLGLYERNSFNPFELEEVTQNLRSIYLSRGFYEVEIFQPSIQVVPAEHAVDVIWKIAEGRRYEIEFEGYFRARSFLEEMVDQAETLPEWYLDEVTDRIRDELVSDGYLQVEVTREEKEITKNLVRVYVRIDRGPQYRLLEPRFIGVNQEEEVRQIYHRVRQLRPGHRFNEEDFREKFEEAFFQELLAQGFVEAKVRTLEFSIDRASARVQPLIYMNEGPQYFIDQASILGVPEEFRDLTSYELLEKAIQSGKKFNPLQIDELQNRLLQELASHGFLDASIQRINERKTESGFQFDLQVLTGPRYRVAEILVRGLYRTQPRVIYSEILFNKGDFYSREDVNDTISQILRLGIARSVDILVFEKLPEEGLVYLVVDIIEASRFRFELGPGYGTVDGLRAVFRATYANINGTGRRLSLITKTSRRLEKSERPTDVLDNDSEPRPFIERRVILEYFEPSLFNFPLDGRLTLSHRKEAVDNFDLLSNAFAASLDYRLTRNWTYTPEYRIEYSNPFNVPIALETLTVDDTSPKRLHSLGQTLRGVHLDDNFSPTKGLRNTFSFELFDQRLGGNLNFWLFTSKNDVFVPLFRMLTSRSVNFGLSLNSGFSRPFGDTVDIPIEKRYRVGGERSVRGYSEASIQPLDRDGEPLRNGGRSQFFFRSELAIPIAGSLDLLGFFDGGNIYSSNLGFNPFDLRYGTGAGIRFNTPVGPLKLGYAFVLDRQEGEDMGQIYFGVGAL